MSGGHYDYAYSRIQSFASDMDADIESGSADRVDYCGYTIKALPEDILLHMRYVSKQMKILAEAAHDVEWYMSGDYGDNCLREARSWKLSQEFRHCFNSPEDSCHE